MSTQELEPVDTTPPEPTDLALFDDQSYRRPAKIGVRVAGTVWLDQQEDAELISQLRPGAAVHWTFEGQCVGGGMRVINGADGQVEGTQFLGSVNVHSVYQAS